MSVLLRRSDDNGFARADNCGPENNVISGCGSINTF